MLYLAADHRGFALKEQLKARLLEKGVALEDLGAHTFMPQDDYPDYAQVLAQTIQREQGALGIALCGSGGGMSIALNKFDGIRAGAGETLEAVAAQKRDDNINVLVIPADFVKLEDAYAMAERFLREPFKQDPKYQRRLDKIKTIEQGN